MPFLDTLTADGSLGPASRNRNTSALASGDADVFRPRSESRLRSSPDRICAAHGCSTHWMLPWKNRRRPIFEQEWACSSRCLAAMVRAAVRREAGETTELCPDEPHRHRVPLGLVLLAQGWITNPQLQTALQSQRASGRGRIGECLSEICGLNEERIARGLGVQWGCPVLTLDGFSPAAMAMVMPMRFVAEFGLLPLRVAGSSLLYMAFQEHMDPAVSLAAGRMSGLQVESGLLNRTRFEAARASLLATPSAPVTIAPAGDVDSLTAAIVKLVEKRQPIATRLVRVHQYYWLRMWLESGATSGAGALPPPGSDIQDCLFQTPADPSR